MSKRYCAKILNKNTGVLLSWMAFPTMTAANWYLGEEFSKVGGDSKIADLLRNTQRQQARIAEHRGVRYQSERIK